MAGCMEQGAWSREHGAWSMGTDPPAGGEETDSAEANFLEHGE